MDPVLAAGELDKTYNELLRTRQSEFDEIKDDHSKNKQELEKLKTDADASNQVLQSQGLISVANVTWLKNKSGNCRQAREAGSNLAGKYRMAGRLIRQRARSTRTKRGGSCGAQYIEFFYSCFNYYGCPRTNALHGQVAQSPASNTNRSIKPCREFKSRSSSSASQQQKKGHVCKSKTFDKASRAPYLC